MRIDIDKAKAIVNEAIKQTLSCNDNFADDTSLVGEGALLDSMQLVELCLSLEDAASEQGFVFDWTSANAMSRSRGMFRNIAALAAEFSLQSEA